MRPNALLIEDDPTLAHYLRLLLERQSWRVEWVDNITDGVRRADTHPFVEVILLDLNLGASDARSTLLHLPRLMRNSPVLVLSNMDAPEIIAEVEKAGAHFAAKDTTGDSIFVAMLRAIKAWEQSRGEPKKRTDRIDLGILKLQTKISADATTKT